MHETARFHIKALHGITGSVGNLVFFVFDVLVLFYYQRVLGLSGVLTGVAILVSVIVDAITDPIIGEWSDRLRARFGRRHTLMFGSVLPMGVFCVLLFLPPANLPQAGLFAWLLLALVGMRVMLTFFDAPAGAVTAEVAARPADRAEMGIYRQLAGTLAYLGVVYVAFGVFFAATEAFPTGQENPEAYAPLGFVIAGALILFMVVAAAGTYRHIRSFERTLAPASKVTVNVRETLLAWLELILKIRNTRALFFGLFLATTMGSCIRALNIHFGTYLWGLGESTVDLAFLQMGQMELWQQAFPIGMLAAVIAARFIVTRTEPKYVYLGGYCMLLSTYVLPLFLTLANVMPASGSDQLAILLALFHAATGAGAGLIMICSVVMFSETTDEYFFVKNISRTALILALVPFGAKIASGIGKSFSGLLLDWVGFPSVESGAAVTPEVVRTLALYAGVFCSVAGLGGLAMFFTFRLTRARHREILSELRERENLAQGKAPAT